ncbi:fungal-specific transcription factor domain-containing protein [Aspergillus filifer]
MSSPRGSKRQRICRACDQCRRRKSKCDGTQPVCKICQAAGRACSYENGGGRRGLPTGYVRSLETALGLLLQHIPYSEKTLLGLLREPLAEGDRELAVERWRASKVAPGLAEMMISGAGDVSLSTPENEEWDIELHQGPQEPRPTAAGEDSTNIPTQRASQIQHLKSSDPLESGLPGNTAALIDSYFVHTHSWFPVLERRDLLRAMHTYPNDDSSLSSSSHLLLWAVIAYTSATASNNQLDPLLLSTSIQGRLLSQPDAPDLGHIQALIILGLLYLQVGSIALAWALMGKVARMLVLLPDSSKSGRFRNLFNGCMLLDNIASAILGRVPTLSPAEQSQIGPVDEDDVEEWDSWSISRLDSPRGPLRTSSIFNRIGKLMAVLSQALYSDSPTDDAHSRLSSILQSTKTILSSHPQPTLETATPPLLNLHLIAAFVEVSTFRQFKSLHTRGDIVKRASNRILDLIDLYTAITASGRSSPLLQYFALQCHNCMMTHGQDGTDLDTLDTLTRLSVYLESPYIEHDHPRDPTRAPPTLPDTSIVAVRQPSQNERNHKTPIQPNTFTHGDFPSPPVGLGGFALGSDINNAAPPFPTPLPSLDGLGAPALLGDTDGLDDLFQEVVTSLPSIGVEPAFAHNLGFCSDDLDVEFMSELRKTPNG